MCLSTVPATPPLPGPTALPGIAALAGSGTRAGIAALALLLCAASAAAVEVNQASVIDLDGTRGIGPAMSARILQERSKGDFKDWPDLMRRIKGIGGARARQLSSDGLTVNGSAFDAAPPLPVRSAAPAPAGGSDTTGRAAPLQ